VKQLRKHAPALLSLPANSTMVPATRSLVFGRFQVSDGDRTAFEKEWAERKSTLGKVAGFNFFALLRRVPFDEDDRYETADTYLTLTVWETCDAFKAWRAGPDFAKWLGEPKYSHSIDETCTEGILPVWPSLGRATTAGGASLAAPGGWREVSTEGISALAADAMVVFNRIKLEPAGYEAYLEQWAALEGAARLSYESSLLKRHAGSVRWSTPDPHFRGHLMMRRFSDDAPGLEYTSVDVWRERDTYVNFLHWDAFDKTKNRRDSPPEINAAEAAGERSYYEVCFQFFLFPI
jgi:heme-degrading monooxygenase HmoA